VEAAAAAAAKNPPAGTKRVVSAAWFSIALICGAARSAHPIVLMITGTRLTTASRQLGVSRLSRLSVPGPPLRGTPKGGGIPLSNRLSSWTRGLHRQILGGSFWGTAKFLRLQRKTARPVRWWRNHRGGSAGRHGDTGGRSFAK
jgi:hypothetical protein